MGENSKIAWTDHTFNPWWGCTKISRSCDNCYAEAFARRFGVMWGKGQPRRTFGAKHWGVPLAWNAAAQKVGKVAFVFTASMSDLFDKDGPKGELARFWALTKQTPWLTYLVLTKRAAIKSKLPEDWGNGYPNVWLGVTIESQDKIWRVESILQVPAVRYFVSHEPLLERISMDRGLFKEINGRKIGWGIIGGESGTNARLCEPRWIEELKECYEAWRVPVFVKQMGTVAARQMNLNHPKGENPAEWPKSLQVRQRPGAFPVECALVPEFE